MLEMLVPRKAPPPSVFNPSGNSISVNLHPQNAKAYIPVTEAGISISLNDEHP